MVRTVFLDDYSVFNVVNWLERANMNTGSLEAIRRDIGWYGK